MKRAETKGKATILTALFLGVLIFGMTATTAWASDSANPIDRKLNGEWESAYLTDENGGVEWYRIVVPSDGEVNLQLLSYVRYCYLYLYTEDLSQLAYLSANGSDTVPVTASGNYALSGGTYLIKISPLYGNTGSYKLYAGYTAYGAADGNNDSYDSPQIYTIGTDMTGDLTLTDQEDWYKITVTTPGTYVMTYRSYQSGGSCWKIQDQYLINTIASNSGRCVSGGATDTKEFTLEKGVYYLHISYYSGETGKYTFSIAAAPCSHTYTSSSVNPTYFEQGYMLYTCSKCGDTYKDSYTSKKSLSLSSLTNQSGYVQLKWSKVSGATSYYVYRKTSSGSYKKIAAVKSGSTVSYKDKTAKNGTTYTYKVVPYKNSTKGAGSGKKIVRLTAGSLTSAKNSSAGKLAVRWKKNAKATGYQVQWSTSSSFKSKTSKKVTGSSSKKYTISGLSKGKTYYVRVRPYKKVSGKTYYAAWSSSKKVKVKK